MDAWGCGLTIDPASPDSGETLQSYFEFTITPDVPPYLGTTLSQVRFVRTLTDILTPLGIPLLVGEFGGRDTDPNVTTLTWTMTQAFWLEGVAWTVQGYNGSTDVFADDGSLQPWAQIVIDAAGRS